jgi:hypothetical protein
VETPSLLLLAVVPQGQAAAMAAMALPLAMVVVVVVPVALQPLELVVTVPSLVGEAAAVVQA